MKIINEDNIEYECNKFQAFKYLKDRCYDLKSSLRFVVKTKGHLMVRCPLTGEYLILNGSNEDIDWLHDQLVKNNWYRKH